MSNCYDLQLPLVAHVRHSIRNLELLAHSLVDNTVSWPHELVTEPNANTGLATSDPHFLETSGVTACVVPQAVRRT